MAIQTLPPIEDIAEAEARRTAHMRNGGLTSAPPNSHLPPPWMDPKEGAKARAGWPVDIRRFCMDTWHYAVPWEGRGNCRWWRVAWRGNALSALAAARRAGCSEAYVENCYGVMLYLRPVMQSASKSN